MATSPQTALRVVRLVFLLAGALFFIIGLLLTFRAYNLTRQGTTTTGRVIALEQRTGSEGGTLWAPIYVFTNAAGESIQVTSSMASTHPGYKTGDQVPLIYHPTNPESARINTFAYTWLLPVGFSAMGLIAILVAYFLKFLPLKKTF